MSALRALRTIYDRRLGRHPLYEEITPSTSWTDTINGRTLTVDIPGFKKEEVNIEVGESGNVTIKGRHDVGSNRFRRFSMTVTAPENTDMKGIVGNVEGGLYTVVFPKMDVPEAVQERFEAERKQLEADELNKKTDKGTEPALVTEASDTTEKAAIGSSTEAAVDKTATDERELETPTNTKDTVSAVDETVFKKTLETYTPEAEKVINKKDEIVSEIATKPLETSAVQELQTISKPPEAEATPQESETVTKPKEAALYSATASDNATVEMDTGAAVPEANTLSGMFKADDHQAADTTAEVLRTDTVKCDIWNEHEEHEGIKKDGGFLDNVMEMITEHKACIISAILAFSMGFLISRRISS